MIKVGDKVKVMHVERGIVELVVECVIGETTFHASNMRGFAELSVPMESIIEVNGTATHNVIVPMSFAVKPAYNWQADLDKLHRAYDRACEDGDVSKQESLVEEMRQIEEIIEAREA